MHMFRFASIILMFFIFFSSCNSNDLVTITVGGKSIQVEIAADPESQARGLMYRRELDEDSGMLFVFPDARERSFWMRNTYIPLSIAYIDEYRRIISISDMRPLDETSIPSRGAAKYALEMNRGWFRRNGISVGDQFTFPLDLESQARGKD
jgi:uncharacterized membrane protein (UPF0127 family)